MGKSLLVDEGALYDRIVKVAALPLSGATIQAGTIAWINPENVEIEIGRVEVKVDTVAAAAGTLSAGTTVVSAGTSSANLIDTLDVHGATGLFDNSTDKGANGKTRQPLAVGGWVTVTSASGDVTGLVGTVYIHYHRK